MSTPYERLNLAQSVAVGPNGRLIRLVSRIAMLTIEVPAAMRASDWPEQRRIRGDLDEALARLREHQKQEESSIPAEVGPLVDAGQRVIGALVMTPRGSKWALEQARAASADAVHAAEAITAVLGRSGEPEPPLLDS